MAVAKFYHLTRDPVEALLPTLIGKALEIGLKVALRGTDLARMQALLGRDLERRFETRAFAGFGHQDSLIGRDAQSDLAVLKIDAGKTLPFVRFGNSETSRVGDWVIAIGNPYRRDDGAGACGVRRLRPVRRARRVR